MFKKTNKTINFLKTIQTNKKEKEKKPDQKLLIFILFSKTNR